MTRRDSGFLFARSLHTLHHFNQRVLRHWRELSVDFDEDGFFATELNYGIVKVKKVREGDTEGGADKVEGILRLSQKYPPKALSFSAVSLLTAENDGIILGERVLWRNLRSSG